MQDGFVNIEYLRDLGVLSGNSNGPFHVILAVRVAEEIGNIDRIGPECCGGAHGEIKCD
jgi:hypothetical protein